MDRICIHVYLYTRGRTVELLLSGTAVKPFVLWVSVSWWESARTSVSTQEYAGKSIALPNVVRSSERKFNSGFGAGQGTHRSTRELQCEREGQWRSPKAELL